MKISSPLTSIDFTDAELETVCQSFRDSLNCECDGDSNQSHSDFVKAWRKEASVEFYALIHRPKAAAKLLFQEQKGYANLLEKLCAAEVAK